MTLIKLFATATLAVGLAFSANAELIKQSFDLELEGVSTTIELGALTENSGDSAAPDYFWADDQLEYFNILGLDIPGSAGAQDFMFAGADLIDVFSLLEASAYRDSVSGDGTNNGFFEIVFEIDLAAISDTLTGVFGAVIFNDEFGTDGLVFDLFVNDGAFTIEDLNSIEIAVTPGSVSVNAPMTGLLVLLSIGGLFAARRK